MSNSDPVITCELVNDPVASEAAETTVLFATKGTDRGEIEPSARADIAVAEIAVVECYAARARMRSRVSCGSDHRERCALIQMERPVPRLGAGKLRFSTPPDRATRDLAYNGAPAGDHGPQRPGS